MMTEVRPLRRGDNGQASAVEAMSEVEGQIRDVIRNLAPSQRTPSPESNAELGAAGINAVIARVSAPPMGEVERIIGELQAMRSVLQRECQRVQGEVLAYSQLNQAAVKVAGLITEGMGRWKEEIGFRSGNAAEPVKRDLSDVRN